MAKDHDAMQRDPDWREKKISFTPNVRLGDILTMLVLVATGALAWSNNNARVTRLEEIAADQKATNGKFEITIKETAADLRGDIREVSNTVRRMEIQANRGRGM